MANVIEFNIKAKDKTASALGKVSKSIGTLAKRTAKLAAVGSAAAAATAFFTKKIADADDKAAKFARRIGVAVEQLTTMQFVASQSGVSAEQFNMAIQRMTRRVGEAAQGLGEAKQALVELGIDAQNFSRLPLDQQMNVLADRFSTMSSESDKLRLAFKLFDSEGTAVLQMLKGGSEQMKAAARDAEFLGLVVGKQAAANAEAFSDAWGRLTGSVKGVSRGIAGELIPILTGLFNKIANWLAENRDSIVGFVKSAIKWFFTFGAVLGQIFTTIKKRFTRLFSREGFDDFVQGAKNVGQWFLNLWINIFPIIGRVWLNTMKASFQSIVEIGKWAWENIKAFFSGKTGPSLGELIFERIPQASAEALAEVKNDLNSLFEFSAGKAKEAGGAVMEFLGINIEAAQATAQKAIESLQEFGTVVEDERANQIEAHMTFLEALKQINDEFLSSQRDEMLQTAQVFFDSMMMTAEGLGQAFAETIVEGKSLGESLKALAKNVIKQLIASLIQLQIQRALTSTITALSIQREASAEFGKAVAAAGANAAASTAAAPWPVNLTAPAVGAIIASQTAGLVTAGLATGQGLAAAIPREHGGPVDPGRTYLVGEKGPELIVPRQSGTVIPNDQIGGSVTIENIQIDILPNATNASALLEISDEEWDELVAGKILAAINRLDRQGVRLKAIEEL